MSWLNVIDYWETPRVGARAHEVRYRPPNVPLQDLMYNPTKNIFGPQIAKKIELRRTLLELYTSSTLRRPPMSEFDTHLKNGDDPFRYEHLQQSGRIIRLIQISPPAKTSCVQQWGMSWEMPSCHIETFELSPGHPSQPYLALSYAWGDLQAPKECIMLNNQSFQVTKTLYDFLCFFRSSHGNRKNKLWIWIDQICINQLDDSERSHTVSFMADIYREASFVVAWLGYDIWSTYNAQSLGPMPRDFKLLLHPILDNPYFTRLWIVQEILLAREVHLVCGHIWLPLDDIAATFHWRNWFIDPQSKSPAIPLVGQKLHQRLCPKWHTRLQYRADLNGSIVQFCDNACQDPRDKVYAMMGFVKAEDQVPIDYTKTVEQVFREAFQIMARNWLWNTKEDGLVLSARAVLKLAKFMLPSSQHIVFVKMLEAWVRDLLRDDPWLRSVLWEFSRIQSVLAIEQG